MPCFHALLQTIFTQMAGIVFLNSWAMVKKILKSPLKRNGTYLQVDISICIMRHVE